MVANRNGPDGVLYAKIEDFTLKEANYLAMDNYSVFWEYNGVMLLLT